MNVLDFGNSEHHHRTKAATEKQNDLWCYKCDSMSDGERCQDLQDNSTSLHMKCSKEHKKCQVCQKNLYFFLKKCYEKLQFHKAVFRVHCFK